MMLKNALILGSLLTLIVSCRENESQLPQQKAISHKSSLSRFQENVSRNNRVPNNAIAEAISCDELWAGFVAANPVGAITEYTSTTLTSYSGAEGLPEPSTVVETYLEKVTQSDDIKIAIEYTYSTESLPAPSVEVQELNKADFLATCNAPATEPGEGQGGGDQPVEEGEAAANVQIVGEGSEKLTVPAGEFDTDWVKATVTQTGDFIYSANVQEWYLSGTDFLIKSVTDANSTYGEVVINSKTTVELTQNTRPL